MVINLSLINAVISIHAPTRGATVYGIPCTFKKIRFQSTLLQEERHSGQSEAYAVSLFQSTLLQEERRGGTGSGGSDLYISIHAPTRGATAKSVGWNACLDISIHAPTRGATPQTPSMPVNTYQFQSTLLQEERQQKCTIFLMHLCNNYCIVSI